MSVVVVTSNPSALLETIRTAIREGRVVTWTVDADGDFTHSPDQWRNKAWFHPNLMDGKLVFNILPPKKVQITNVVYAVYHGRMIEMLLTHFDSEFERAVASSLPSANDRIGKAPAPS